MNLKSWQKALIAILAGLRTAMAAVTTSVDPSYLLGTFVTSALIIGLLVLGTSWVFGQVRSVGSSTSEESV